jgi:VanZ family protein
MSRFVLLFALMVAIYILSSIPGYARPDDWKLVWLVAKTPPLVQKTMHLVLYAGLSWLVFWALESLSLRLGYRVVAAFVIAVGFGAFNEWRQIQMPGRYGTFLDVALNAVGAAVGLLVAVLF